MEPLTRETAERYVWGAIPCEDNAAHDAFGRILAGSASADDADTVRDSLPCADDLAHDFLSFLLLEQ